MPFPRLAGPFPCSTDPDPLRPTAVRGLACPNVITIDALSNTTPTVSSRATAALNFQNPQHQAGDGVNILV
jgi:hypothetical protein